MDQNNRHIPNLVIIPLIYFTIPSKSSTTFIFSKNISFGTGTDPEQFFAGAQPFYITNVSMNSIFYF